MNEHIQALQALAEKLGQRVEALWPLAVRYTVVEAVVGLALVGVLMPLAASLLARRWWKKAETLDDTDGPILKGLIALVLAAVLAVALGTIVTAVPILLNPEGYLVAKLLERK